MGNNHWKSKLVEALKDYNTKNLQTGKESIIEIIFPFIADNDFDNSKKVVDETFNLCLLTLRDPYPEIASLFGFLVLEYEKSIFEIDKRICVIEYFLEKIINSYETSMALNPTTEMFINISSMAARIRRMSLVFGDNSKRRNRKIERSLNLDGAMESQNRVAQCFKKMHTDIEIKRGEMAKLL